MPWRATPTVMTVLRRRVAGLTRQPMEILKTRPAGRPDMTPAQPSLAPALTYAAAQDIAPVSSAAQTTAAKWKIRHRPAIGTASTRGTRTRWSAIRNARLVSPLLDAGRMPRHMVTLQIKPAIYLATANVAQLGQRRLSCATAVMVSVSLAARQTVRPVR